MATQAGSPAAPRLSPQVICSVFVEQYYHILHETPDQAHKFYQDASRIGRTGSDGVMEYVTTLPEISKKIMAMDFSKYLTEIETADSVLSHNGGVLIVVTGSLTMVDDCQRFTQSFFLAPQDGGGYFVLNDIFRLITQRNLENGKAQNDGPVAQTVAVPTAVVVECPTTDPVADVDVRNPTVNGTIVQSNQTANGTVENNVEPPAKVTKEVPKKISVAVSPSPPAQKDNPPPAQKDIPKKTPVAASPPPPSPAQKDVTKKTYASIVKVMKEAPPTPVVKPKPSPKPATKPVTKAVEGSEKSSVKPSQTAETTPAGTSVAKNKTSHDEQGYSVFIKGLPYNSTVQMVEEEFKKFGTIKPSGIQVRNNKIDQYCFGFVEFESEQSMQAAIQASPLYIGDTEVGIEQKRTSTRVVNGVVMNAGGGGRFQYGRGHRGDNFRGRGGGYMNSASYRGGDNFNRRDDGEDFTRRDDGDNFNRRNDGGENFNRRNDFRNRNEFSGRGRGPPQGNGYHNHNGNGFHQPRPFQNDNGRYARVNNGPKQTPVAAA
ncbi:putative G3BP-like protein [Hordeum vulgare]|nr:nuclear transport factor 2-like isoform X1 [Hordeum vulgare subsp. vulgare]KAE8786700.1 putative G3BP-like protein [Hordeum vulgare]KAI5007013.1 hypothetical protein ZWY2020_046961 [Hordeum vulgare]BAK04969.1 predicted protein [Hordeum vulgare subsp. vulgare]